MNTLKFIIVVSMVLLATDLIYQQDVGYAQEQTEESSNITITEDFDEWIDCVLYNDGVVTVLNQLCEGWRGALNWYTTHGYQIRSTDNYEMYLQK